MDICGLILADHHEQRLLFAQIEDINASDKERLAAVWRRLLALLDTHAEAEEQLFYPAVLKVGTGAGGRPTAADETKDAIKDHNEIRNAAAAVRQHEVGSDAWFAAVDKVNKVNGQHMSEEEREGLTDMRRHGGLELRHALGVKFAAFDAANITGVTPVDKDPKGYVKQNS